MKKFINTLLKNEDLKRGVILTTFLVGAVIVYFFYSVSDLPFVYSQF